MNKSETKVYGGPGVLGWLGIMFVGFKLCGIIDWSWWYVLIPFYIPLVIILICVIAIIIIKAIKQLR